MTWEESSSLTRLADGVSRPTLVLSLIIDKVIADATSYLAVIVDTVRLLVATREVEAFDVDWEPGEHYCSWSTNQLTIYFDIHHFVPHVPIAIGDALSADGIEVELVEVR